MDVVGVFRTTIIGNPLGVVTLDVSPNTCTPPSPSDGGQGESTDESKPVGDEILQPKGSAQRSDASPSDRVNDTDPSLTDRTSPDDGDSQGFDTDQDGAYGDSTTAALTQVLAELTEQVANFHDRAAAHEELIAKMHARIEKLQSGETKKLLKPISTQLIALYSDLEDTASELRPDTSIDQVAGLLTNFSLTVESILDNLGLLPLQTAAGDAFEPRLHHAIKRVDTSDPASDRTIAVVLRQGFAEPGEPKPLVPSRVSVYRYDGSAPTETPTADSGEH
jgi:molecular chaperone GrpE (heat shock protein)